MDRLAFEDAEDSFFLLRPRPLINSKCHEMPGQCAEQRSRSIALTAKCPVLVGRIADEGKIFIQGFERNNLVRNIGRLENIVRPSAPVYQREKTFILHCN